MQLQTIDILDIVNTAVSVRSRQARMNLLTGAFSIIKISPADILNSINILLTKLQVYAFKNNIKIVVVDASTLIDHIYFNGAEDDIELSMPCTICSYLRSGFNEKSCKLPNNNEISALVNKTVKAIKKYNNIYIVKLQTDYDSACIHLNNVSPIKLSEVDLNISYGYEPTQLLISSYDFYNLKYKQAFVIKSNEHTNACLDCNADLALGQIINN